MKNQKQNNLGEKTIKNWFENMFSTQLKKNIIYSSLLYVLNSIMLFVSYPVYLHFIDLELFGLWTILSVVITFAELGNFGLGDALVKYISEEKNSNDNIVIKDYFSSAFYTYFVSSMVAASLLILFDNEIAAAISIPEKYLDVSLALIPLLSIVSFLYLMMDSLKSVIVGFGRLDIANIVFISSNFTKLIIAIILFILGFKIWALFISVTISLVISIIIYIILIYRFRKINIFALHKPNFQILKRLLKYGSSPFGSQILSMIIMPVIKVILARGPGLVYVSYFEIGSKIPYMLRGFFEKGIYAIFPEISNLHSASINKQVISNLVKRTERIIILICVPLSIVLGISSPFWMNVWLGSSYNTEISVSFNIILVGMLLSLIVLPYYYSMMGIGKERYSLYEASIRVSLNLVFVVLIVALSLNSYFLYISFALSTIISNFFVYYSAKKILAKYD